MIRTHQRQPVDRAAFFMENRAPAMKTINIAESETESLKKSLAFLRPHEADLGQIRTNTTIEKSMSFEEECERLSQYYAPLGIEHRSARLVFHPAGAGKHRILINAQVVTGSSWMFLVITELIHLANLIQYNADHGNVYRFTAETAIDQYYYEFLLWTKFQAMKIATRCHACSAWHELNGNAPPDNGCYQFTEVTFRSEAVRAGLRALQQSEGMASWREELWNVLEELALYFGRMALYQTSSLPQDLDDTFPGGSLSQLVGLDNCVQLYAALGRAVDYESWLVQKKEIRQAIVAMQEHGKAFMSEEGKPAHTNRL